MANKLEGAELDYVSEIQGSGKREIGGKQLWKEIAKFMDGKSMVMLALSCKWFYQLLMDDTIWKYSCLRDLQDQACLRDLQDQACLRDLQVPDPRNEGMKWIKLFASASDGSHSFTHVQKEKHTDWMRMGSFLFESSVAFLTFNLKRPLNIKKDETVEKTLQNNGCCLLNNVKNGIWLADLHLLRCPACDFPTCDGTMLVLDARHIELFLCPEYQNGSWNYELLGSTKIQKHSHVSSVGIFDFKHLSDAHTEEVFDLKSWTGKANDEHTEAKLTLHGVAVHNNLKENEGLNVKFHVMRAGKEGEVVSIRISQQLL